MLLNSFELQKNLSTRAIEQVKAGNYLMDIAGAIQDHVEANDFVVVEKFHRSRGWSQSS